MTELSVDVEQVPGHGATVIRAAGPLTALNRHHLRRAVLRSLKDMPTAVIVDLTGVHLVDRVAGAAFAPLRREAARTGPGIHLFLCGVRDQLLAQRIRSVDRAQLTYPTLEDAIAGFTDSPAVSRRIYHHLPDDLHAPIEAGTTVADACTTWGLSQVAFPARAAAFDLSLVARRCPPGWLSVAASHDDHHLLISVRTRPYEDSAVACSRFRPAPGYHHKAGSVGHIVWTALPTVPSG
jgi:anti-anti-sigma regulatory factor